MRRKINVLILNADKKNFEDAEKKLMLLCDKWGIAYVEPPPNETKNDKDCRILSLTKEVSKVMRKAKLLLPSFDRIESELKRHCEEWNVEYEKPLPREPLDLTVTRRRRVRKKIKDLKMMLLADLYNVISISG